MAIYFISDLHLGSNLLPSTKDREAKVVRWLDFISADAEELFLMGDIFDFWFDYGEVVPKGYVRLLGALAKLSDRGVKIHFFTGNHDLWMFDYLSKEIGAKIYHHTETINRQGLDILLGHGDGLGPGDKKYKFIKNILSNKVAQKLFSFIHPDIGLKLMRFASNRSRIAEGSNLVFTPQKERIIHYCEDLLSKENIDVFIFGHRHLAINHLLSNGKSRYFNLGEWWSLFSYIKLDRGEVQLLRFEN
jgi:UDP-2,3-diacylglucosamine hydrolase